MESAPPATRFLALASMLLLCVAGLLIAMGLRGTGAAAVCGMSGCRSVLGSEYSHVFGWSVASVGTVFYAGMILLWGILVSAPPGRARYSVMGLALILAAIAVIVSAVLTTLQFFVLHAVCPLCLTSAGICAAIGWNSFFLFRRNDRRAQPLGGVAVLALLAVLGFSQFSLRSPVIARIGGQVIGRAEMERAIGPHVRQPQWEIYRAEKNWLDEKLADMLVEREAAARHVSPGALVQIEVNDPVARQVDDFMKNNAAGLKPGDRTIVRTEMRMRFKTDRTEEFVAGLMKKYHAEEFLVPPAIDENDLAAMPGPHRGGDARTAPIRLVVFSDFGCEYCAHTSESIAAIMKHYGERVSLTFHYLPLDIHYRSREAAIAGECAAEQEKFWPVHDALIARGGMLAGIDFATLAEGLGLNRNEFTQCLSSPKPAEIVDQSKERASRLGINSVPAVFLDGNRIGGDLTEADLNDWIVRLTNVH